MKILWAGPNFLHPTTKGGQIRTLEMLKWLHRWHEVHYIAFDKPDEPEGRERAGEYSTRSFAVRHDVPSKRSLAFAAQVGASLVSPVPLAVSRWKSKSMCRQIEQLVETERYDRIVCDFLAVAPNIPDLSRSTLFQHNVETSIWERHAATATGFKRALFSHQAARMAAYEEQACRNSGQVIAVSAADSDTFRQRFRVNKVAHVPTGVDVDYFNPDPAVKAVPSHLVFVGSMDWMPNVDGVEFFVRDVLPLIWKQKDDATFSIVGRTPPETIQAFGRRDPRILVTGTVPDIRPYMWGASVSVVPLRVGGGTRLKIFEAMAAKVPVVSTAIGAEGLPVESGKDLFIADTPEQIAARCLELMGNPELRCQMAAAAWRLVSEQFSWEHASRRFEEFLKQGPPAR